MLKVRWQCKRQEINETAPRQSLHYDSAHLSQQGTANENVPTRTEPKYIGRQNYQHADTHKALHVLPKISTG